MDITAVLFELRLVQSLPKFFDIFSFTFVIDIEPEKSTKVKILFHKKHLVLCVRLWELACEDDIYSASPARIRAFLNIL